MRTTCKKGRLSRAHPTPIDVDLCWTVPHGDGAVSWVRRDVKSTLEACGVSQETVDSATLIVSELTTNAVTHALPPVMLRVVTIRQALRIEVVDAGAVNKAPRHTRRSADEHGRGHVIVAKLACRTGQRADAGRVSHWAEVPAA
ncbi:ATP-binding protein [Streptomyces sp. SudanB66_2053]|uniref:ATP-binding protein n=1 Tax=Streptomyces sp. SudanB66_2053 TaxID=3035277 RepID=UPI003F577640